MFGSAGNRIDNGTFTRPKKSHERPGPMVAEREREEESYHQHEGTDVETLAKQQEESKSLSPATCTVYALFHFSSRVNLALVR